MTFHEIKVFVRNVKNQKKTHIAIFKRNQFCFILISSENKFFDLPFCKACKIKWLKLDFYCWDLNWLRWLLQWLDNGWPLLPSGIRAAAFSWLRRARRRRRPTTSWRRTPACPIAVRGLIREGHRRSLVRTRNEGEFLHWDRFSPDDLKEKIIFIYF